MATECQRCRQCERGGRRSIQPPRLVRCDVSSRGERRDFGGRDDELSGRQCPSGNERRRPTVTLTYTQFAGTGCSGSILAGPTTATISPTSADTILFGQSTGSFRLAVPSSAGTQSFSQWTSQSNFSSSDNPLCFDAISGNRTFTANYVASPTFNVTFDQTGIGGDTGSQPRPHGWAQHLHGRTAAGDLQLCERDVRLLRVFVARQCVRGQAVYPYRHDRAAEPVHRLCER